MLNKIRRVVRFFVNLLNDTIWFVARSKGVVVKAHCHVLGGRKTGQFSQVVENLASPPSTRENSVKCLFGF